MARDGGRHDADRPGPRDQHILAQQIELLRRVHGIAERIEQGPDLVGNLIRQFDNVEGRDRDEFGESPLSIDPDAARGRIQMEMPGPGRFRVQIYDMPLGRDPLADLQRTVDGAADGNDLTGKLMAGDHRHRHVLLRPLVPIPDVNVSAAHSRTVNADQDILRTGCRDGGLNQVEPFGRRGLGQGLHHFGHQMTPSSRPALVKAATV